MAPVHEFTAKTLVLEGRIEEEVLGKVKSWCAKKGLSLTEEQLCIFLLGCDSDTERTENTIEAYFKYKKTAPEIFKYRNMEARDVQNATRVCELSVFPVRTRKNQAVIFGRLKDFYYYNFPLEGAMKLFMMVVDYSQYKNPSRGIIVVIDLRGVSLFHLTRAKYGPLQKFFHYVIYGIPCQIEEIHILNTVYFIDKLMLIFKPFMKKETYSKVKFHPISMDMDKFFQEHLPRECFPGDYDGNLLSQKVLSLRTYNNLRKMNEFFDEDEKQIELYRLKK